MKVSRSLVLGLALAGGVGGNSAVSWGLLPAPDHIVILVEENRSDNQVYGNATFPFFNSIVNNTAGYNAAKFTNFGNVAHPSEPNYIAMFSGSTVGTDGSDADFPHANFANVPNLGAKLIAAGKTFTGYSEGLPAVGSDVSTAGVSGYARKHNPWVNWQDTYISTANKIPAASNRPFAGAGNWPSDFSQLPAVSYVIPNLANDGHDTSNNTCDNWMQTNMTAYLTWAKTHNSLLIITWDEDEGSGKIATTFVGPMVQPGVYNESINHYNVLRTIEGIEGLGQNGATVGLNPITDVWAVPEPASLGLLGVGAAGLLVRRRKCATD